ncbi:hypothetical protein JCM8115_003386 [Rhodotorula mucilaginosa]
MATASHASHTSAHTTVITRHAFQGAQAMSLFSLAVLPFSLVRHPLRPLSTHLRRTALRTLAFGPALGIGYAFFRINSIQSEQGIEQSALAMRADRGERRREDYATIGAVIGALATTAILLRRAPLLWTISGGASLGLAGGTLYSFFEGAGANPAGIKGEAKNVEKSVKGG